MPRLRHSEAHPQPITLVAGLDHVQIEAPAGGETDAFYSRILDLPKLDRSAALPRNGRVWFGLPDGRQLHVRVVAGFTPRTGGHPARPSRNAP